MSARVLVVDDDPSVRDLLVDLLEADGYRVSTAPDGDAALALAEAAPPDLVIADVGVPGLDGPALAAALVERGLGALPVLFTSGGARPASVPPERFFAKPFDVTLLLRAVADAIAGRLPSLPAGPTAPPAAPAEAPPLVLVVEDDAATRAVLHDLLVQAGYRVAVAATGAQALVALAAVDVALVLLDLVLPDLDGLELCLRVRAREGDRYLPIVMLTALGSDQQRHAGFAAGADDYIVKPFCADDLLDRVGVWVRAGRRLRAAQEQLRRATERRARDEGVMAMARTAGDELRQPLTVLLGMFELWRAGRFQPAEAADVEAELQGALDALLARVETLERAEHYATKALGNLVVLDLDRAVGPSPLVRSRPLPASPAPARPAAPFN